MNMEDIQDKNMIILTIVTVCLNANDSIARTIESILCQDFRYFEYIVLDGCSIDGTNEVIESYQKMFIEKKIPFRHSSKKDNGIFDAMNMGIKLSKGKWITFLNANDTYCHEAVLSKVFTSEIYEYDYVYGGSYNGVGNEYYYRTAKEPSCLYYRMPFVHQSAFVRIDVIKKYMFDDKYFYSADFDQFVKIFKEGKRIKVLNYPIVYYDVGGISNRKIFAVIGEHECIRLKHGIFFKRLIIRYIRYVGMIFVKKIEFFKLAYISLMKKDVSSR